MNFQANLQILREQMLDHNIDALMIPSSDPHQSEYLPPHWKHRQWLTGFTGSAGTALITQEIAGLWTDFRYWIQAEKQIKDTGFMLFADGKPKVPSVEKWLLENLNSGQRLAVDGTIFSMAFARKIKAFLEPKQVALVTDLDLVSSIWAERPDMPNSMAYDFPVKFSGESRKDKIKRIRQNLKNSYANWLLITALDDLAWTFNLRGKDVPSTPVNIGFALISQTQAFLFMDEEKISLELTLLLDQDGIVLKKYEDIYSELNKLTAQDIICLDPARTSVTLASEIPSHTIIVERPSLVQDMKSQKNSIEINHSRDTAVKDGAAMVNFMFWLSHETAPVTELSASQKLYEFRQEQEDLLDTSFSSITAYGAHGAMCHYSPKQETDVPVEKESLFLFDSGGNYLTGTTDITRTVHLGTPSQEEIIDYTRVLKSHIGVARAIFPEGTRGYQIDTIARQTLWENGQDFGHGTGHGVGFFLAVHEGPAKISPHPIDVSLVTGMILTNEPGIYREGKYGIRLENMILVQEAMETEFAKFLQFETLTLCPFEANLIDSSMLTIGEKEWINAYHQRVYNSLSKVLPENIAQWLKRKTDAIQ